MRLLIFIYLFFSLSVFSQPPAGYYASTGNLSGVELQTALNSIIKNHTAISYAQVWNALHATDKKANGKVWDIYSDTPGSVPHYEYSFSIDQCGQYSGEGSCYNREHSFPTSWFGNRAPMNTDLFQIYPTDGNVNQMRGNYPYGETSAATWVSTNGSKLGPSAVDGYGGIVFEPIDEYKGDLARTYFYMATRYKNEDADWTGSPMVDGSQPKPWAMAMLMQWHINDPVSPKEIERNNQIFNIQGNRNPFIDRPEFAEYIWGDTEFEPIVERPSKHVENFSTSFISLSWHDAEGEVLPDGYLVLYSDKGFDYITMPQNGVPVINYAPAKLVAYGQGGVVLSGLEQNTNYYIKVIAYTGHGTQTMYKTDGELPKYEIRTN